MSPQSEGSHLLRSRPRKGIEEVYHPLEEHSFLNSTVPHELGVPSEAHATTSCNDHTEFSNWSRDVTQVMRHSSFGTPCTEAFGQNEVTDEDLLELLDASVEGQFAVHSSNSEVPADYSFSSCGNIFERNNVLQENWNDFPLDDDIEAEMAQLLPCCDYNPIEPHPLPSSLRISCQGLSSEMGIHDGEFQHSSHTKSGFVSSDTETTLSILDQSLKPTTEEEDWGSIRANHCTSSPAVRNLLSIPSAEALRDDRCQSHVKRTPLDNHDSDDYQPLAPFARPKFPVKIRDRSPVIGLSSATVLRTCFRIGEALHIGAASVHQGQDAIIELFARLTFSFREPEVGSLKQHFQFADLFHDRPPFVNGVLSNYKTTPLQDTESKALVGNMGDQKPMVRCIGRLKRLVQGADWYFDINCIRHTDWEEIRYTKLRAGAGMVDS